MRVLWCCGVILCVVCVCCAVRGLAFVMLRVMYIVLCACCHVILCVVCVLCCARIVMLSCVLCACCAVLYASCDVILYLVCAY